MYAAGSLKNVGLDRVGVMANFDFEDLSMRPGDEARSSAEAPSPRQTKSEMPLVVESIAKLVECQVRQEKKREKAEARQKHATKQAAELHIDLARETGEHVKEMGEHVKGMSMHVDQRFDALG